MNEKLSQTRATIIVNKMPSSQQKSLDYSLMGQGMVVYISTDASHWSI